MKSQFQSNLFSMGPSKSLRIAWLVLSTVLLIVFSGISSVSASNGDVSCYERGIIDGEDHPFNQETYDKCGNDYYQGFISGCLSVDGNSRDSCESATDG